MHDQFYLLEETIQLMQVLKHNLKMQELDPRTLDLGEHAVASKIYRLIANLDILLSAKDRDPRLLKLVVEVEGLRNFLNNLMIALKEPAYFTMFVRKKGAGTLMKINQALERIMRGMDEWVMVAEEKMRAHQKTTITNEYLRELPKPVSSDYFYIMVKELNPVQTRYLHPFDSHQLERQQARSTEDILKFDAEDPITGMRQYAAGDNATFPGSSLRILAGHHRTFELYRRFLQGKISGDLLLLVKRAS